MKSPARAAIIFTIAASIAALSSAAFAATYSDSLRRKQHQFVLGDGWREPHDVSRPFRQSVPTGLLCQFRLARIPRLWGRCSVDRIGLGVGISSHGRAQPID